MFLTALPSHRKCTVLQTVAFTGLLLTSFLWRLPAAQAGTGDCTFNGPGTNWSDNANWSCGFVPDSNFINGVTIANGKTVNLGATTDISNASGFVVHSGAVLNFLSGNPIFLTTKYVQNYGTINITSNAHLTSNTTFLNAGILTISGGDIRSNELFTNDSGSQLTLSAGDTLFNGGLTNNGTITGTFGNISIAKEWTRNATSAFNVSGCSIFLTGTVNQTIPVGSYRSITISHNSIDSNVSLAGDTTINILTLQNSTSILKISANQTLTSSIIENMNGLIQIESGAKIILPAVVRITNGASSEVAVNSFTAPTNAYIFINDDNRNLNGQSSEIITAQLTGAGGDSETITLTQAGTGQTRGKFYSSAIPISIGGTSVPNNGKLELSAAGQITLTYTDPLDPMDTKSVNATVSGNDIADITPPTVSFLQPKNGDLVSGIVYLNATAEDNVGINSLKFEETAPTPVVISDGNGNVIKWDTTNKANGTYTLKITASDAANNSAFATITVTVKNPSGADNTPPVVIIDIPQPGVTVSGTNVPINTTITDGSGLSSVTFAFGETVFKTFTTGPYTMNWDSTSVADGQYTLSVTAKDNASPIKNSTTAQRIFIVKNQVPPPTDSEKPTVRMNAPLADAQVVGTVTLQATADDTVGVAGVTFKIDGFALSNEITSDGPTYSTSWDTTAYSNGTHSIAAVARDAANNSETNTINVTINNPVQEDAPQNSDTTPPTISITKPADGEIVSGTSIPLFASAADDIGVIGVIFEIDQIPLGNEVSTQPYSKTWDSTSVANGQHVFTVVAHDLANNTAMADVSFTVNNQSNVQAPVYPIYPVSGYSTPQAAQYSLSQFQALLATGDGAHKLVKLADDGNPFTQEDTAVYYIGADGKRHAFANSKVFFTWYCNFDDVITITPEAIATLPLGKNVTYHPGVRMVKFVTNDQVYAVTGAEILRPVASEEVAAALYGASWNTMIDDIADSFYTDYTIGSIISSLTDYNVAASIQSVLYPSDVMHIPGYTVTTGLHPFVCATPLATVDKTTDTDGDGLTDYDEANLYKTDPSKVDTDGDGYSDYQEVMNGFNPLGPGKCATYKCIL